MGRNKKDYLLGVLLALGASYATYRYMNVKELQKAVNNLGANDLGANGPGAGNMDGVNVDSHKDTHVKTSEREISKTHTGRQEQVKAAHDTAVEVEAQAAEAKARAEALKKQQEETGTVITEKERQRLKRLEKATARVQARRDAAKTEEERKKTDNMLKEVQKQKERLDKQIKSKTKEEVNEIVREAQHEANDLKHEATVTQIAADVVRTDVLAVAAGETSEATLLETQRSASDLKETAARSAERQAIKMQDFETKMKETKERLVLVEQEGNGEEEIAKLNATLTKQERTLEAAQEKKRELEALSTMTDEDVRDRVVKKDDEAHGAHVEHVQEHYTHVGRGLVHHGQLSAEKNKRAENETLKDEIGILKRTLEQRHGQVKQLNHYAKELENAKKKFVDQVPRFSTMYDDGRIETYIGHFVKDGKDHYKLCSSWCGSGFTFEYLVRNPTVRTRWASYGLAEFIPKAHQLLPPKFKWIFDRYYGNYNEDFTVARMRQRFQLEIRRLNQKITKLQGEIKS